MAIKLITGLKQIEEIESQDDGARIFGTISKNDRVLDVGNKWSYQIVSNNLIRVKDGELLMQGRHVRQSPNTYTDLTINNGTQGMLRNDIIVVRYTKNLDTGIENVELDVVEGVPCLSNVIDPEIISGDIFSGTLIHEMPLYRVHLDGINISSVDTLFSEISNLENHIQSIEHGGTGATTASAARINLSVPYCEDGTWTPIFAFWDGSFDGYTTADSYYYRKGNTVFVQCKIHFSQTPSSDKNIMIAGLPFTSKGYQLGSYLLNSDTGMQGTTYSFGGFRISNNVTMGTFTDLRSANISSGQYLFVSATYRIS